MKTSVYNIYINLPKLNQYILVHGYTGAIDLINDKLYKNIKYENFQSLSQKEIIYLLKRGYLTEKTKIEEKNRVADIAKMLLKKENMKKNYSFLI